MTVGSTTVQALFTGNGGTTDFPFTFYVLDDSHLTVTVDAVVQVLGTDYTVTINADQSADPGGTVVFVSAPTSAADGLVVTRVTPLTQETDYPTAGTFPAASHETALDKLTLIVQELEARIDTLEAV